MSSEEPQARLARMVAGMSRWVAIESPTHDIAAVNHAMDAVVDDLAGLPIAVERVPGRDGLGDMLVLRAGPASGAKGVLVMSHLDTVHPIGTLAHDLPLRTEGDKLFGPGIYDMKGGAYLALEAFRQVAVEGGARLPMTFLFTPDEEIGSPTTPGADRGSRPQLRLRARHRAGPRRRQGRHGPQGGRAVRRACGGPARPFRRAARGGAQRHPRGRAADPRGRGA